MSLRFDGFRRQSAVDCSTKRKFMTLPACIPPHLGSPGTAAAPYVRERLDADIAGIDLEPVSYLVAVEQGWDLERIDSVEFEYRCFLQLIRDNPEECLVPSRECDTYWHSHILILELYLAQCEQLFGRPLLHYPFSGHFGTEDVAVQTAMFERSQTMLSNLARNLYHS